MSDPFEGAVSGAESALRSFGAQTGHRDGGVAPCRRAAILPKVSETGGFEGDGEDQ